MFPSFILVATHALPKRISLLIYVNIEDHHYLLLGDLLLLLLYLGDGLRRGRSQSRGPLRSGLAFMSSCNEYNNTTMMLCFNVTYK